MVSKFALIIIIAIQLSFTKSDHSGKVWEVVPIEDPLDESISVVPLNVKSHNSVLETHMVTGHGIRTIRSHILESPELKTHLDPFEEEIKVPSSTSSTFWHSLGKRSVELIDKEDEASKEALNAKRDVVKALSNKYTNLDESKNEALPSNREARGATKEQWIKQPYPVDFQTQKDDQRALSSNDDINNVRAPRVHFVTNQKRLDAAETRDRNTDVHRVQSSVGGGGTSTSTRTTRMYESRPEIPSPEYKDRRRGYERDYNRYDLDFSPRYPTSRYNEYELNYRPPKKQQRIIYYATLPEVVRTPPNVDLRYRSPEPPMMAPPFDYYYDRRYMDSQVTSSPVSVADRNGGDPYYDREGRYDLPPTYTPRYYRRYSVPPYPPGYGSYHSSKLGYEVEEPRPHPPYHRRPSAFPDNVRGSGSPSTFHSTAEVANKERLTDAGGVSGSTGDTTGVRREPTKRQQYLSPVKISTGVNVKESDRKVPERRIYADREREYVYAPPSFQLADDESIDTYHDERHRY